MNENETLIGAEKYDEEWYGQVVWCTKCGCRFMSESKENYCPECGRKIVGLLLDNEEVYNFKEANER